MSTLLFKNIEIVNEGNRNHQDLLVENGRISRIDESISHPSAKEVNGEGIILIPGVIDDQVHFREPGLTHKATIKTESMAAAAGGTTSFMEMPNTQPPSFTHELLEQKYDIAANDSIANYSFYLGTSHDNLEEIKKSDPRKICGLKIFMGSSTGNLLVDDDDTLERIFSQSPMLIATHCEDEATIRLNIEKYQSQYGDDIPMSAHPLIRNEEACFLSSSKAIKLANETGARLHILHITTEDEVMLFQNDKPLRDKQITSEVCAHHLWFNSDDYEEQGSKIKCNPAIKTEENQKALLKGLLDDRLDILASDHAPHMLQEKDNLYLKAPSGIPLVQHTLLMMLDFYQQGLITLEEIVRKMCHAPAICFNISDRGFIREGYWADLVMVDLDGKTEVTKDGLLYKCNWSPFEGYSFPASIVATYVNGHLAYDANRTEAIDNSIKGARMTFNR